MPSTSSQDRTTGNGFTLPHETTKTLYKVYETIFEPLNIQQPRWEISEVSHALSPNHCLERVSRMPQREEESQTELS